MLGIFLRFLAQEKNSACTSLSACKMRQEGCRMQLRWQKGLLAVKNSFQLTGITYFLMTLAHLFANLKKEMKNQESFSLKQRKRKHRRPELQCLRGIGLKRLL